MSEAEKTQLTRRMQIIVSVVIMGTVVFGGVLVFVFKTDEAAANPGNQSDLFFYIGLVMAALVIPERFIVINNVIKQGLSGLKLLAEAEQEQKLWNLCQTKNIINAAVPNGACLACLVFYMMEGNSSLLFLVAGLLMLMIWDFPTRFRIDNWVEARMAELEMKQ